MASFIIGGILTIIPSEVLLTKPLMLPIFLFKIFTATFSSFAPYRTIDLNQLMRLCVINTIHKNAYIP
ncbi:hypothetical protein FDC22_10865 [Clostridium botulinum]|uniref:Uncharacterized protein n=1 Tax=Clostridium botulinum (strain Okra / Type B1) TaxID=498213 RepID=B1IJX6_CLOBK|nr:hypothetical protein [Clostridium botulinum]ACA46649.1 hypothetical protein CLD_3209 [Clostridium botulinum B1 str. Okra]MBD5562693.1 hypothetical protein [Clostridium botulinum]MBD5565852.1 hypothetical protein [Clostridium botulinum]MBD5569630.1 hypothetical protein [Clostridium botulinum]MBD5573574.1 hypothetical protein [Clostridium botulinum]